MQAYADSINRSLENQETLNYLFNFFVEFKKSASTLSDMVEETNALHNAVQQSCKALAELEDWINDYTLTTEVEVSFSMICTLFFSFLYYLFSLFYLLIETKTIQSSKTIRVFYNKAHP